MHPVDCLTMFVTDLFLDKKLCGGDKRSGLGEAEMEALLDKVLLVFKFLQVSRCCCFYNGYANLLRLQGQDVFEAHYKKTLARRLLLETSCNIDLESFIIRWLMAVPRTPLCC